MKKLIFTFILLGGLIYLSPSEVIAQTVSTTEVDAKTQEKIQKSKEKLIKYNEDHQKGVDKLKKMRADFDKKNAAGKLSPNDVEKITKKIGKQTKSIEKIEKEISKLEEYIRKNS
jgi:peptidoglycan hydrolase CwlO-like protein